MGSSGLATKKRMPPSSSIVPIESPSEIRPRLVFRKILEFGLLPSLLYFIVFCAFTFPLITQFTTHFFCDTGDGLQNVWNIWWVNKAVTELHCSPWYTTYLHYPHGVTLLGHTLNVFNGFMGIVLLRFMTLTETHNFVVIFSFVVGGLTAFWLAYYFTRSYWGGIIGGFIFTFSDYHFAHAQGHLQLVSLEWIPLFLLCFFSLLKRPRFLTAIGAALSLFLVILCDYYYFFYCVIAGVMMVLWQMIRNKDPLLLFRSTRRWPFAAFVAGVLLTSGVIVYQLLSLSASDPFAGSHDARRFSTDIFAPFVPSAHWRFGNLTKGYWSELPEGTVEGSVYMGLSVLIVLTYVLIHRRKAGVEGLGYWFAVILSFYLLSLGPSLHINGVISDEFPMPYSALAAIFPFLDLSGCPVRMMVMATLGSAVIAAAGFKLFFRNSPARWIGLAIFLTLMILDFLPSPMPATRIETPNYVTVLAELPGEEGLIDIAPDASMLLYYQTIHNRPMAGGYVSRLPASVSAKDDLIMQALVRGDFRKVSGDYHLRYLAAQTTARPRKLLYDLAQIGPNGPTIVQGSK